MLERIDTSAAPAAIGPYSQAVKAGSTLYVSGQIPVDPSTGAFAGSDITSQTRQCFENIKAILAEAGYCLCNVVKMTVLLKNMDDFAAMNEVYASEFSGILVLPARVAFEAARLPKGALVEIDAIAVR